MFHSSLICWQLICCLLLLQANADWSALAADAAKRKRIVSVASMRDAERLIVEGCSNNQRWLQTVSAYCQRDLNWLSEKLCNFCFSAGFVSGIVAFCTFLLVSWAWWNWPFSQLTNNYPSVQWHCWLGHVTHEIVHKMTYVSSGSSNPTVPIPIQTLWDTFFVFALGQQLYTSVLRCVQAVYIMCAS